MRKFSLLMVLLIAASSVLTSSLFAQERIEPPFWWAGMKSSELQILVYEEGIGHTRPEIEYPGVRIDQVIQVENDKYLFLYLTLDKDVQPGTFDIVFMDGDEEVLRTPYELKQRRPGAAEVKGFDGSDVMYLITPDRFANGNPDNDFVEGMKEKPNRDFEGGRHGGDIAGLRKHLDYIEEMGFTAIWLNPILENDMHDYSYHGYAATDFYKVDSRYGTNEEYLQFIREAKERDIIVIMDMILNHSGSEHWFVLDPPTADWINFGGEYVNTSHRKHTIQDIHASEYDKKAFVDGWFVVTMPDLNQKNPLMKDYLITNTIWWIEYSEISGIRMDTYPYPDKDFMTEWTFRIMDEYPNFNVVGEEWIGNPAIVSYWQAGKKNHDGYVSYLPSLMDFPVQEAVRDGLRNEERQYGSGLIQIYEMVAMDFLYPDPYALVVFPDNHDMDRFYTSMGGDIDKVKMALALYTTMRGTPQIYYGTEILMENDANPSNHGFIRGDFPGGWDGDQVNGFSGQGLTTAQKDAQAYLKKMLNWRKGNEIVHHGKLMQFVPFEGVYAYFRYTEEGVVMTVLNKNKEAKEINLDRFAEILKDASAGTDIIHDEYLDFTDGKMMLPAKATRIIEVEK